MMVMELARIAANAIGINKREGLIFARRATPNTRGMKNAAEAVLLMKVLIRAVVSMIVASRRKGLFPV